MASALALLGCFGELGALYPCEVAPACSCGPGEVGTAWCGADGSFDRCICQTVDAASLDGSDDPAADQGESDGDVSPDAGTDGDLPSDASTDEDVPPGDVPVEVAPDGGPDAPDQATDTVDSGAEDGDAGDGAADVGDGDATSDAVDDADAADDGDAVDDGDAADDGDLTDPSTDPGDDCESVVEDPFDDGVLDPCWQTLTIGDGLPGSAAESTSLVVTANGADIASGGDQFVFVYQHVCGDVDLTLRVNWVPDLDPWSKSGLMIRENLTPNSLYAAMLVTDGNDYVVQVRTDPLRRPADATGGNFLNDPSNPAPGYIRLVRSGAVFTGYYSSDGVAWTALGDPTELEMHPCPWVGIATTAHTSAALGTASYNDFTATQ